MAGRRGRFSLSAPRHITFVISLLLAAAALVSLRIHLPVGHGIVAQHRFWFVVAAYGLLVLGVVLPGI